MRFRHDHTLAITLPEGGVHIHLHIHASAGLQEALNFIRQSILERIDMTDQAIQAGLDAIASDITPLTSAIDALVAKDTALAAQLAQAIEDAKNAGASPEQLQSLTDFHTALTGDITKLNEAALAHTTADPAAPQGPAGDPGTAGNSAGPDSDAPDEEDPTLVGLTQDEIDRGVRVDGSGNKLNPDGSPA